MNSDEPELSPEHGQRVLQRAQAGSASLCEPRGATTTASGWGECGAERGGSIDARILRCSDEERRRLLEGGHEHGARFNGVLLRQTSQLLQPAALPAFERTDGSRTGGARLGLRVELAGLIHIEAELQLTLALQRLRELARARFQHQRQLVDAGREQATRA